MLLRNELYAVRPSRMPVDASYVVWGWSHLVLIPPADLPYAASRAAEIAATKVRDGPVASVHRAAAAAATVHTIPTELSARH